MSVVNWLHSRFDIYIGRFVPGGPPGIGPDECIFGNPFILKDVSNIEERAQVIAKYEYWLMSPQQEALVEKVKQDLKGKKLGCWCKPADCHGNILLAVANESIEATEERRLKYLKLRIRR